MQSLVWRAMADGAVGFSTGLQYVPGTYAKAPEIIDLARVAGNAGGVYATHMRNEGTALEAAVEESIRVGSTTGARVQISHLKVDSPSRWGASEKALAMIDAARAPRRRRRWPISTPTPRRARRSASAFRRGRSKAASRQIAERLNDPATVGAHQEGDGGAAGRARPERSLVRGRGVARRRTRSLNGLTMKQVAAQAARDPRPPTRSSRRRAR